MFGTDYRTLPRLRTLAGGFLHLTAPLPGPRPTHCQCGAPAKTRGLCARHYLQHWRAGTLPPPHYPTTCLVVECTRKHKSAGLCHAHWKLCFQRPSTRVCCVLGCNRPVAARDRCNIHYKRLLHRERRIRDTSVVYPRSAHRPHAS